MSDDNRIRTGLWKNAPDKPAGYGGTLEIDGKAYFVNLYKNDRKTQDNHPDLNLILKPKTGGRQQQRPQRQTPQDDPFVDDELPGW